MTTLTVDPDLDEIDPDDPNPIDSMVELAARLLMTLLHFGSLKTVRRVLVALQPWAETLPEPDLDQLMAEFEAITTPHGPSPDQVFQVAAVLQRWRNTVEGDDSPTLSELIRRESSAGSTA